MSGRLRLGMDKARGILEPDANSDYQNVMYYCIRVNCFQALILALPPPVEMLRI